MKTAISFKFRSIYYCIVIMSKMKNQIWSIEWNLKQLRVKRFSKQKKTSKIWENIWLTSRSSQEDEFWENRKKMSKKTNQNISNWDIKMIEMSFWFWRDLFHQVNLNEHRKKNNKDRYEFICIIKQCHNL